MSGWRQEPAPMLNNPDGRHTGWLADVHAVWREGRRYLVMIRTVETEWGEVKHAAIRNRDETDIPWAEKQRIKNDLFGYEAVAIEVFPAKSRLVDEANMYHLWVLPKGFVLPFGIHESEVE